MKPSVLGVTRGEADCSSCKQLTPCPSLRWMPLFELRWRIALCLQLRNSSKQHFATHALQVHDC